MSEMSDYMENELLDHALGEGVRDFASPTALHVALFTAAPSDAGGRTEVTGGGYARQTITFGAAASGVAANTDAPAWTASGANYGTVTHFALFDAVTAGNMLFWSPLTTSRVVNDGDTLNLAIGALTVTFD